MPSDEAYNCEWSQELRLEQSFDGIPQRLGAHSRLGPPLRPEGPGTHFNMSVGYNRRASGPNGCRPSSDMRDAGDALPGAIEAVARLPAVRDSHPRPALQPHHAFHHARVPPRGDRAHRRLPPHGAGRGHLGQAQPDPLGPTPAGILNDTLGFDIEVPGRGLGHDPKFPDAMAMVKNLAALAKGRPTGSASSSPTPLKW